LIVVAFLKVFCFRNILKYIFFFKFIFYIHISKQFKNKRKKIKSTKRSKYFRIGTGTKKQTAPKLGVSKKTEKPIKPKKSKKKTEKTKP
jgi:hypothetical protein